MITIMDFYADWCKPCKMQDTIIEKIRIENIEKFKGKLEFKKINIENEITLTKKYNVELIPTIIIKKDDYIIKRYNGLTQFKVLEKYIINELVTHL